MKVLLGICFVALIVVAGMAVWESGRRDYSSVGFYHPTSAAEFMRRR